MTSVLGTLYTCHTGDKMEVYNPLYKNQGIHVILSLFTVEKGITKILLIKRKNQPFKDFWALVGGALYNNEDLEQGMIREIKEKTGIENIDIHFSGIFGKVDRSPVMRMVAITYIGFIDNSKVSLIKESLNTSNADWFALENIPNLAFDHKEILLNGLETLREKILTTNILKGLFPMGFTLPELQKTYESIFDKKIDRRNFRKKILNMNLLVDTNKTIQFQGNKPAKVYKFKHSRKTKNIF